MSNPVQDNKLGPLATGAQEVEDPWTVIPVAVRQSFKDQWREFVKTTGLKQSQYARMVLHEDLARKKAA